MVQLILDIKKLKKTIYGKFFLAHYDPNKNNIVKTDSSKTGLGITPWQKPAEESMEPIALGSRYVRKTKRIFQSENLNYSQWFGE